MTDQARGRLFVAIQVVLLVALVVAPSGDDWSVPGWLSVVATIGFFAGLALVGLAALGLGPSLTATPVPKDSGRLVTEGFYAWVRHPIYTGVLAVVVAMTVRSGSWITLAVGVATALFFNLKASWEERKLAEHYPEYEAYAASTPRFVPGLGRLSRS